MAEYLILPNSAVGWLLTVPSRMHLDEEDSALLVLLISAVIFGLFSPYFDGSDMCGLLEGLREQRKKEKEKGGTSEEWGWPRHCIFPVVPSCLSWLPIYQYHIFASVAQDANLSKCRYLS